MPVTIEEMINKDPLIDALEDAGITPSYLARKLKAELSAKSQKVIKGSRDRIILGPKMVAWDVRQKARIDAQRLRGDYPAEKKEVRANVQVTPHLTKEDREMISKLGDKIINAILVEHRERIVGTPDTGD